MLCLDFLKKTLSKVQTKISTTFLLFLFKFEIFLIYRIKVWPFQVFSHSKRDRGERTKKLGDCEER